MPLWYYFVIISLPIYVNASSTMYRDLRAVNSNGNRNNDWFDNAPSVRVEFHMRHAAVADDQFTTRAIECDDRTNDGAVCPPSIKKIN